MDIFRLIACTLIYMIVLFSTIIGRKKEAFVLVFHVLLFLILVFTKHLNVYKITLALCIGIVMSIIEYICIKYYGMWHYNYVKNTIPLWLPMAWTFVTMLIIDALDISSNLKK